MFSAVPSHSRVQIPCTHRDRENAPDHKDLGRFLWLGKRDGNITFDDSLDFDISEIESVYEDDKENQ